MTVEDSPILQVLGHFLILGSAASFATTTI